MINVNRFESTRNISDTKDAMLIIGKGESEFKNKDILKANSIEEVEYIYGIDSELTNAFKEALEVGATDIYLCNCYKFTDYIDVADIISKKEFAYITPLYNFSETFVTDSNKTMYLCEYYSNILSDRLTQLIITDQHASLYEDLNHFIKSMNKITMTFKDEASSKLINGENLCFILNGLEKFKYANVALAGILMNSDLKYYPNKDIGQVVFDVNNYDVYGLESAYFAYDDLAKTTIENFLNFREKNGPEKFVPINLIKQKILRTLDFSDYSGKLFTPYIRISLENKFTSLMTQFVGTLIESYKLQDIVFIANEDRTLTIYILLSIKPFNSIEEINLSLEV